MLSQCSGLVAEERLGAEAAISYRWMGALKMDALKIENRFTSFNMQNVLQRGF